MHSNWPVSFCEKEDGSSQRYCSRREGGGERERASERAWEREGTEERLKKKETKEVGEGEVEERRKSEREKWK